MAQGRGVGREGRLFCWRGTHHGVLRVGQERQVHVAQHAMKVLQHRRRHISNDEVVVHIIEVLLVKLHLAGLEAEYRLLLCLLVIREALRHRHILGPGDEK